MSKKTSVILIQSFFLALVLTGLSYLFTSTTTHKFPLNPPKDTELSCDSRISNVLIAGIPINATSIEYKEAHHGFPLSYTSAPPEGNPAPQCAYETVRGTQHLSIANLALDVLLWTGVVLGATLAFANISQRRKKKK